MERNLFAGTAIALVMFAVPQAHAWDVGCRYTKDVTAGIDAQGATQIIVRAGAGDLDVRGVAGANRVEARGGACASDATVLEGIRIDVRRDGSVIHVETVIPKKNGVMVNDYGNAILNLGLALPDNLPLIVTDSSGDATIANVAALEVQDSSGDLTIRNIAGAVAATDSSGDLLIESVGSVRLDDSSGDVRIRQVAGDAEVTADSSGNIEFDEVRGNATVTADSSGDIEARNIGGDFRVGADTSGTITHTRVQGNVQLPD